MTNRKAAYIDFSKPEYKSLSDDEVSILKSLNSKGNRKNLRNCKIHGLYEPIFLRTYDEDCKETQRIGCLRCLELRTK